MAQRLAQYPAQPRAPWAAAGLAVLADKALTAASMIRTITLAKCHAPSAGTAAGERQLFLGNSLVVLTDRRVNHAARRLPGIQQPLAPAASTVRFPPPPRQRATTARLMLAVVGDLFRVV